MCRTDGMSEYWNASGVNDWTVQKVRYRTDGMSGYRNTSGVT